MGIRPAARYPSQRRGDLSGPHESTHRIHSASAAAQSLDDAVGEASRVLRRISRLYGILADHADPEGEAEAELAALIDVRARLSAQIGRAVLQVLASGGSVSATPPGSETAEPTPSEAHVPFPVVADRPPPLRPLPSSTPGSALRPVPARAAPVAPRVTPAQREALKLHASTIGVPAPIESLAHAEAAAGRLTAAVVQMDRWLEQPQEYQKALIGLASSLARQIQDETEFHLAYEADEALRSAFSRMTAWSREHRPGFVPGLSRSNAPDHGSWLDDGRHWWRELHRGDDPAHIPGTPEHALHQLRAVVERGIDDRAAFGQQVKAAIEAGISQDDSRLVTLLAPHPSTLRGVRNLKTLREALRAAWDAQEAEAERTSPPGAIPPDWPQRFLTEGKRLVVLGGDPRKQALERIQAAFDFGEATWEEMEVPRVIGVAERARMHQVDIVLLLRSFVSQRILDIVRPACQRAQVPLCVVDEGYGVLDVKQAIERYFAAHVGEE